MSHVAKARCDQDVNGPSILYLNCRGEPDGHVDVCAFLRDLEGKEFYFSLINFEPYFALRRRELPTTETDDMPIIRPAVEGVSIKDVPSTGRSSPDASGMLIALYAKEKNMFSLICSGECIERGWERQHIRRQIQYRDSVCRLSIG